MMRVNEIVDFDKENCFFLLSCLDASFLIDIRAVVLSSFFLLLQKKRTKPACRRGRSSLFFFNANKITIFNKQQEALSSEKEIQNYLETEA